MISRHWKGTTRPGQAEAYVRHLQSETLPQLLMIAGFVSATILRRDVHGGTEFQIVTLWESVSAIQAFAGQDIDVAVVPAAAQAMLLTFDRHVMHYEVAGGIRRE